jgi:nucleoside-diphosphate-sugar epimerase
MGSIEPSDSSSERLRSRAPGAAEADIRHSVLDTARTERALGWRAETSLADGLARTWK